MKQLGMRDIVKGASYELTKEGVGDSTWLIPGRIYVAIKPHDEKTWLMKNTVTDRIEVRYPHRFRILDFEIEIPKDEKYKDLFI